MGRHGSWAAGIPTPVDSDLRDGRHAAGQHRNGMWNHRFVEIEKYVFHRNPVQVPRVSALFGEW